MIEWFGLEWTFKGHIVQPLQQADGSLQLDQVAQCSVQLRLEYSMDGASTASPGNMFQCLTK